MAASSDRDFQLDSFDRPEEQPERPAGEKTEADYDTEDFTQFLPEDQKRPAKKTFFGSFVPNLSPTQFSCVAGVGMGAGMGIMLGSATGAILGPMFAPAGRRMATAGAMMVQQSSWFALLFGVGGALQCAKKIM